MNAKGLRWAAMFWLGTASAADPTIEEGAGGAAANCFGPDSPVDAGLQEALAAIDRRVGDELGIAEADRACGLIDLGEPSPASPRLGLVRPDTIFYGASVPKVCILLAYFETHPEAADRLDPQIQRELELMIKRSSNELASKYSRIVGLEAIQNIQRSEHYGLYSAERGGLWSGKHYGIDEPRTPDPLGGHSHAATVRACLRFFLLLEQGKLVSQAASRKMREIFAAPLLEFHNDGFVAGLKGRDVRVIRKNGLWEDWHLDAARIESGGRIYLLAGMARHARGDDYLTGIAAAADELLRGKQPPTPFRHRLVLHERAAGAGKDGAGVGVASYESPVIDADHPFNEVLPSWNVDAPAGASFVVELRVGRRADGSWSPYLQTGDWGEAGLAERRLTRGAGDFEGCSIDVDYLRSKERFDRVQYRVRAVGREPGEPAPAGAQLSIERVALCLSDTTGLPDPAADSLSPLRERSDSPLAAESWQRRLPVPYRSQRTERPDIAGHICSPTSTAMVMAYRGVDRPTLDVALRIYDPAHGIFGVWPRAVQAAYSFGVPGYVARFSEWREVERQIAAGQPLIISIRAAEGELKGAPYPSTDGHLLVLAGFDSSGNVLVNDPAAATERSGLLAYTRSDLERVWLRRGGTSYVLLPREAETDETKVAEKPAPRPPNVVVIMTDDQGYGDLGFHGNPILRTPRLDALARESVRLQRFFVAPVCSPTRASLLTGRYHPRTGVVDTYIGRSLMHPGETTLAELLAAAGYRTGIFGKWHLGDNHPMRPIDQGFEEALVLKGGGIGQPSDPPGGDTYFDSTLLRNGRPEKTRGYVTDVITDAALDFIARRRGEKFFAYLAYNAPHAPLEVPDDDREPYRGLGLAETTERVYAMVSRIDRNVGRILDRLAELKLDGETVVVFLTDNGPQQGRFNGGLRGRKGTVFDGGIRVPCFIRWPGPLEAGHHVDQIAAHIDLTPTLLDACRVMPPAKVRFDGRSLLPLLRGGRVEWPGRTLFFQWHRGDEPVLGRAFAARDEEWKLLRADDAGPLLLFHTRSDPWELEDVSARHPEVVERLRTSYEAWFRDVSATRGFAPPRILLGTPHEDPVVLTRQDWRGPRAGNQRDALGHWEVEVARDGTYEITLHYKAAAKLASVKFSLLGASVEGRIEAGQKRSTLGPVKLPRGAGRVEAVITEGEETRGVEHVEVRRGEGQ